MSKASSAITATLLGVAVALVTSGFGKAAEPNENRSLLSYLKAGQEFIFVPGNNTDSFNFELLGPKMAEQLTDKSKRIKEVGADYVVVEMGKYEEVIAARFIASIRVVKDDRPAEAK